MVTRWGWLGVVAMLAGCPDDGGRDPRQTCAQMGTVCGFDDYGVSCGSCGAGAYCNAYGRCAGGPVACSCGTAVCGNDSCGNAACGTCGAGRICNVGVCSPVVSMPTDHVVGSERLPLFTGYRGVTFTIPAAGVGYAATSPTDTFSVGIFTPTDWAIWSSGGSGARAWAVRERARAADGGETLPAGSYVLGFRCDNSIQRCDISYSLVARY